MTDDLFYEGSPPGYSRNEYRGVLNLEGVLTAHYRDMMRYMDSDIRMYCSSVESFILGCPDEITDKGLTELERLGLKRRYYDGVTPMKMILYDDLFRYVKRELKKVNIIFKSGQFEIGHD